MDSGSNIVNNIQNKSILLLFITLLISLFLLFPKNSNIFIYEWINSHSYSHGLLLLGMSFYLIANKPNVVTNSNGNITFLIILLLLVFFDVLASIVKIDVVSRFVLPCYLIAAIGAIFGAKNLLKVIIPLSLIFFTVPSWSIVSPIFQSIAAIAVANISDFIGIPTFIEGNYVSIPNGTFLIAEGCSGVRYILVAVAIALINCELSNYNIRHILTSVIAAFVLAIVANWVRIQVIVIYAHLYGMDHSVVADHNTLGWIIFAIFMAFFFFILPYIAKARRQAEPLPVPSINKLQLLKAFIAIALLASGPLFIQFFSQNNHKEVSATEQFSQNKKGTFDSFHNFEHYSLIKNTTELKDAYEHNVSKLSFDLRDNTADMTHAQNKPIAMNVGVIKEIDNGINNIKTYQVIKNNQRYFYSYWYEVNNKITQSLIRVKFYSVQALLSGSYINQAFFISTKCELKCSDVSIHLDYVKNKVLTSK
ncbi:MAG: exosortase [Polaribacter sp.]|jgi:exosortase